ncbi:MAG: orotate phosphoribosyltransferase [Planctomycetaceae bacterium]
MNSSESPAKRHVGAATHELIELVAQKALSRGTFRRASGREARYFLDSKQVVLDARGAMLVGSAILERLESLGLLPDAVGGMSIGADPVTSAVVTMAGVKGLPLSGFLIRKEPKGHGTQRYIEGPVRSGMRVVIVEDVVTSGGSSLLAIDRAEEFGLRVERVVTVVDRLAGGSEAFAARGVLLEPLLTIRDLGLEPT